MTCISRIHDETLRTRLNSVADIVERAAIDYEEAAVRNELHLIEPIGRLHDFVTRREMEKVYSQRMAKKNAPGRRVYDDLIMLAEQGRCPFCGQRLVNTIDHHLPKAYFPELVVTPINMIPSCSDCNKLKLDRVARRPEDVLLHPYFDTVNDVTWLYAQLLETSPPGLFFFVDGPEEWDDSTNARVRNHFAALKLNELYAATAADELFSIRYLLGEMWHHSGKVTVREYLLECAESAGRHRLNGWKRAAYQAWAGNDWFCDGGFEALE